MASRSVKLQRPDEGHRVQSLHKGTWPLQRCDAVRIFWNRRRGLSRKCCNARRHSPETHAMGRLRIRSTKQGIDQWGLQLFQLRRDRIQNIAARSHNAAHLLLAAIQQVLRFKDQAPTLSPHSIKLILCIGAEPFARLFSGLRSKQDC